MNWFSGNIAEAVALSKAKNSIFVVYCEGKLMLKLNTSLYYTLSKQFHVLFQKNSHMTIDH